MKNKITWSNVFERIEGIGNKYVKSFFILLVSLPYILYIKRILLIICTGIFLVCCFSVSVMYNITINGIVDLTEAFSTSKQRTKTDGLVLHHDDVPQKDTVALMGIRDFHRFERGWESGFAYHYYIYGTKTYHIHRDSDYTIHAENANSSMIGLCIHGKYTADNLSFTGYLRLACIASYICRRNNISAIYSHREVNPGRTECPASLDVDMVRFMVKLMNYIPLWID